MKRLFFIVGALSVATAVAMGAYGAHGATQFLGEDQLRWVEKAVRYQMYHSLGLLILTSALDRWPGQGPLLKTAGWLLILGLLPFSGSLYLMAFSGIDVGYVTPLGGMAFICGWLLAAAAAWRSEK